MYTTEEKNKIAELVRTRLKEKDDSQVTASKQIGISGAYLNHIVKNKTDMWDIISEGRWRLVAIWAGYTTNKWVIRESDNLNSILEICKEAQEESCMMAVIGETGYGKSEALQYYARKNKNSYYVLCRKSMNRKDFLNAVLKSMGLENESSLNSKTQSIINWLKVLPNSLLILDDFGKLPEPCLHLLQEIYDETQGISGIIVGALPSFRKRFFKYATKDVAGYRELKRRFKYWLPLNRINKQFVLAISKEYGLSEPEALKTVIELSPDYGTFRNLMENYEKFLSKHPETSLSQKEILAGLHVGTKDVDE